MLELGLEPKFIRLQKSVDWDEMERMPPQLLSLRPLFLVGLAFFLCQFLNLSPHLWTEHTQCTLCTVEQN